MGNKKILFFDIDETLISHKTFSIPESTKEAIKKATEKAKMKIESKLSDNEYIINYKQLNVEQNDSKIVLELFFTVCEDITDTKKINLEELQETKEE